MVSPRKNSGEQKPKRPPATTVEARENQLIALAVDLAEKQLAEGTASSQVMVHYLKLGTVREQLEREKIRHENLLLEAKKDQLQSAARMEELVGEAIEAMRRYSGGGSAEPEDSEEVY